MSTVSYLPRRAGFEMCALKHRHSCLHASGVVLVLHANVILLTMDKQTPYSFVTPATTIERSRIIVVHLLTTFALPPHYGSKHSEKRPS